MQEIWRKTFEFRVIQVEASSKAKIRKRKQAKFLEKIA